MSAAVCDGCNVREPWGHGCDGEPCSCEDCREERAPFAHPAPVPPDQAVERCPRCGVTGGRHGLVHVRYGNGGGGNRPCPNALDDVVMPRETLAERIKADGRLFRAGYEEGEAAAAAARPVLSREALRERISRAILMVTQGDVDPEYAWRVQDEEVREELLAQADAVLAVLYPQDGE